MKKYDCVRTKAKCYKTRKIIIRILDKTHVRLFPNFTPHHLISHTNTLLKRSKRMG